MLRVTTKTVALIVSAAGLAIAVYVASATYRSPAQETASGSRQYFTLDPALFSGEVRDAYQTARDNPALLAQLNCYCGCEREEGHKNLLDCYRTRHGSTCAICVGEALTAGRLYKQGVPIEQIRAVIGAQYNHGS